MDFSFLPNPYDFANPVSNKALFIGRRDELEEIKYYLDHTRNAPRPINIALLGARASGKTSLLNMAELMAKERNFITCRIDLDEADAENQLNFFYKIFDSIFTEICKEGAFGGLDGKTFDTYLDLISAYSVPEDKTFCPFLFPIQYAKACSNGNFNISISDYGFKKDLSSLYSEIKKPIILLFDEGNVLANSRVHLEKLRNIFMNTPGYMLILTGTFDLFPVIDEVFSPIVRQFKKINVKNFDDKSDTENCILAPLTSLDIQHSQIMDLPYERLVRELHDLSGGRPYEIQLICHMLFKRIQLKRAQKMQLDFSVLEDIKKELETSKDITSHPILNKIINLNSIDLSALNLLCACEKQASFDQIWGSEFVFNGNKKWTKENLKEKLTFFINENILEIKEEVMLFLGDDFDKIYTKYFAREKGIPLNFPEHSFEFFWNLRLRNNLRKYEGLGVKTTKLLNTEILSIAKEFGDKNSKFDCFVEFENLGINLYLMMISFRKEETIPMLWIKFVSPWVSVYSLIQPINSSSTEDLSNCLNEIEKIRKNFNQMDGEIIIHKVELPVIPVETLIEKVEKSGNEKIKNYLYIEHCFAMERKYLFEKDPEEALFQGQLCLKYNPNIDVLEHCNNLGYLFLVNNELTTARPLLQKAKSIVFENQIDNFLPTYNLGILETKEGNIKEAKKLFTECLEKEKESDASCLLILKIKETELEYIEICNLKIYDAASNCLDTLNLLYPEASSNIKK